jgi:hypothetical protein
LVFSFRFCLQLGILVHCIGAALFFFFSGFLFDWWKLFKNMSGETSVPLGATDEVIWERDKLNIFIDNLGKDLGGVKHG